MIQRLPLEVFSVTDESRDPRWLKNLYENCHDVLMMKRLKDVDGCDFIYLGICEIFAICMHSRTQVKANLARLEQPIWDSIKELIIQNDLVSEGRSKMISLTLNICRVRQF